jgi:hypothetical protein
MLFVLAVSMVLLGSTVFAQDKPAEKPKEQPKEQAGPSQSTTGRRFDNLSPEEQAKLKEKWQTMSAEDKAKIRDKTRERVAGENQGAQGQMRRDLMSMELTRLQEQYKTNIGELQAIKQIAIKENAKETIEALTRLIARREQQLNQQIQALQRRMKMLQAAQDAKAGPQSQTQPDKQPKPDQKALPKSELKKEEAKPQNTGTKP